MISSTSNSNNNKINNKISSSITSANKQKNNYLDSIKKSIKKTSSNITNITSRILLVHDPPVSGNKNISNGIDDNSRAYNDYYENTNDYELRRTLLCNFNMPVVMILSDISGKDDMDYNVTKIIPHDIRNL